MDNAFNARYDGINVHTKTKENCIKPMAVLDSDYNFPRLKNGGVQMSKKPKHIETIRSLEHELETKDKKWRKLVRNRDKAFKKTIADYYVSKASLNDHAWLIAHIKQFMLNLRIRKWTLQFKGNAWDDFQHTSTKD